MTIQDTSESLPGSTAGRGRAFFAAIARWKWLEIVFWVGLVALYFLPSTNHALMSQILVWGLFALSLDILLGFRGIASLGHAAFFGIGAYVAGFLGKYGWHEPISGLFIAMAAAAVAGLLAGRIVQRVSGVALFMVTLGMNLILFDVVNRATGITGGDDGMQGIVIADVLGMFRFDIFGHTAYLYTLAVCFVVFVFVRMLVKSQFGLSLLGQRENTRRMIMMGTPVQRDVTIAFVISAAVAGVAGALLTQTTAFVSPASMSFQRSADVLTMLIIGGAARLYGGFIGAFIFLTMRDWLAAMSPVYWYFWIGLLLVVIVTFFRRGILPTSELVLDALIKRFRKGSSS